MKLTSLFSALLLWCSPLMHHAAYPTPPSADAQAMAGLTNHNWQSFQRLPAAMQIMDPANLNRALLDAAVFHETNRRRQQHGLPPLAFHNQARQMAQLQSQWMAASGEVSHTNANPQQRTMEQRAVVVGLRPAFLAENVASCFGRRAQPGTFYVREENGRKIYSTQPGGPAIPRHTYVSLAAALVENWMNSPGHRQNILSPHPKYLGCACEPGRVPTPMETFYCTQVFCTPLR